MSRHCFVTSTTPTTSSSFTSGGRRRGAMAHVLVSASLLMSSASAFTATTPNLYQQGTTPTSSVLCSHQADHGGRDDWIRNGLVGAAIVVMTTTASTAGPAWADEIGREVEKPTFSTGETIEICTKRGPLGACLQTELRTEENDNDKAQKYFQSTYARTQKQFLEEQSQANAGNALIEQLRQQSVDNKEKNDLQVARKTFENDQSATFGPFDKKVAILNTDGRTFTLLDNPQAMRLKDKGFIQNRQFVQQPTEEELEAALTPNEGSGGGIGGFLGGLFGGGGD